MKRLLLAGSDSVHVLNYLNLVKDHFTEVLLVVQEGGKIKDWGVRTVEVNYSLRNPVSSSGTVRKIKALIEEFKPSVIHAHQANSVSYHVLKAANGSDVPVILTAWGSDVLLANSMSWLYRKMLKYNLAHADYFTSDSLFMAAEMQKFLPEKAMDITIANFGINISVKDVPKENIIYSNRLHKKLYRIDKVIEAFAKFHRAHSSEAWKLVVAATGEETEELKRLAKSLGVENAVSFPGWVDAGTNSDYYSRAKIFVSIPESDATAISLLEAMAAGCIPVLSNLPANMEWVLDGVNGIIVTNTSAAFLEGAASIDHAKAAALNKEIIAKKGTKEINRKKFIELYERVMSAGKRNNG